jgi:hypothetical protein
MTLAELRTKANAKLIPFWQMLIDKQPLYFLKHGKFFQLLITPRVVDGEDTNWTLQHPSDEVHQIDVDFPWSDTLPFQVSVDEWVGEDRGFSATATVELPNGDRYRRTRKATAVIAEAVYDNTDPMHPVLVTPPTVSSFTQEDTDWYLVVGERQ